jgi:hypothetical protein
MFLWRNSLANYKIGNEDIIDDKKLYTVKNFIEENHASKEA